MILELFLALLLGIFVGTIAGLLPGIHVNLISVFLLSILTFFLNFVEPIVLIVFIVAMTISDTFVSFIPSIFLGAPDEDTTLSVLPGHELLLKGKGYEAGLVQIDFGTHQTITDIRKDYISSKINLQQYTAKCKALGIEP